VQKGLVQLSAVEHWRERVLTHLDRDVDDMVAALRELVRIPSISGSDEENDIQELLARQLAAVGLEIDHWQIPLAETLAADDFPGVEVERREAWGLVARLPGRSEGRTLMLNAHVDVVPPGDLGEWGQTAPFSGTVHASTVHGRGACDMKGGLVAAQWAARALAAVGVPLRGDLLLACVQGEEDGGLGTYAMLRRGWRADGCIIPEPTLLDLAPANGGSLTFRLSVHGLATHASRRTSGVSAVEKFWPIFTALRALERDRNKDPHPLMARWDLAYPIEIGRVQAGDWASSVPDKLVAEGRYGVALGESVESARRAFLDAIAAACESDPWLRDHPVDVQWWGGQFASGHVPVDSDVIVTLRAAHSSVASHDPDVWAAPYGSDLRLLAGMGGIPTVQYGPGDAGLAHGPRESVPIAEVRTAARALALAAMDYCGL
jgi:acetylornithine deacetylase